MKKFRQILKIGIITGLLCAFLGTVGLAGNSPYSAYYLINTGYTWNNTGSTNTKATTGANWFMQAPTLTFEGVSTSGTLGMGFAPCVGTSQRGNIHWASYPSTTWYYTNWLSGYGTAGTTYNLGARLDSELYMGSKTASSIGSWNSN